MTTKIISSISTKFIAIASIALLFSIVSIVFAPKSDAAPVTGFKPGRIIEDNVFTNSVSMSPAQIQNFLNSKVPNCDTWGSQPSEFGGGTRAQWGAARGTPAPFTCLRNYSENGKSAAQIIYDVSQEFAINPQVFIVLLQKEQGLVTDTWPLPGQYKTATGYGCPDTAPCASQYFGLTNQLRWSGRMFRSIMNNSPGWYTPYILGNNTIRWNPEAVCGSSVVNIENRSTQALYNYTPYRPNQAALNAGYGNGDSCSAYGNRNFYLYFKDWFGYNAGPVAFKTAASPTVYVNVSGVKLAVPYIAVMQDYGISADSIQTVSQAYVDSIPSPAAGSGVSSSIAHLVKSPRDDDEDGGSVYLISRGKRFQIQTMDQFFAFGFKEADISFLPLSYVFSFGSGGLLSNFVTSPYGNAFKISANTKRTYFDYGSYAPENPGDNTSALSYFLLDRIPSGNPIVNHPAIVKYSDSEAAYLYLNNKYYAITSPSVLSCWGFESTIKLPVYRTLQNNYIAPITPDSNLSCTTNSSRGTEALGTVMRLPIPAGFGVTGQSINTDLTNLSARMPSRSAPMSKYVKSQDSASVWIIESGKRTLIPSWRSFNLLGLNDWMIDIIGADTVNSIPDDGITLGAGQVVKERNSDAVYTIAGDKRVAYDSGEMFNAYKNNWGDIETYNKSELDQRYPFQGDVTKTLLVNKSTNTVYFVSTNGCFVFTPDTIAAYGINVTTLKNSQNFESSSFKPLENNCKNEVPKFVKRADQSLVYWVDAGKKYPLNSYAAMLSKNNGKVPAIVDTPQEILTSLTTGATID